MALTSFHMPMTYY